LLTLFIAFPHSGFAQQIEFIEKFVLSADRQSVLNQLSPGSEEFYFFQSLDKQLRGKYAEVDQLLKIWSENLGETPGFQQIRTRQALLTYQQNPQQSLDFLIQQLQLRFDHQRQIPTAEQKLPSQLPETALNIENLVQQALAHHDDTSRIEDAGIGLLLETYERLTPGQQRHLLSRLKNPSMGNLVSWIAADLKRQPNPSSFSDHAIHQQLTLAQMDELARAVPSLRNNHKFVHLFLRKLKPSADKNTLVDWH
jgi:hypothetical protein